MKSTFYWIAVVLLISGCSTTSFKMLDGNGSAVRNVADANYTEETQFEWKITKGDRIEIIIANQSSGEGDKQLNTLINTAGGTTTYQTRDGSEGYLIPTDGMVRLPLVGPVKLAGLTETQAVDKLTNEYRSYLKNPFASVKILNQKLFVLGEVRKPGVVHVTNGTMTLFEALAYSGDLTDDAERTNVRVIRGGLRNPQMREINLANLSEMKLTSLLLQPNDIIYVQPRDMKAFNVAFKEQMPFFDLITSMLSPFVSYTSIKNGKAVDVFLFK